MTGTYLYKIYQREQVWLMDSFEDPELDPKDIRAIVLKVETLIKKKLFIRELKYKVKGFESKDIQLLDTSTVSMVDPFYIQWHHPDQPSILSIRLDCQNVGLVRLTIHRITTN